MPSYNDELVRVLGLVSKFANEWDRTTDEALSDLRALLDARQAEDDLAGDGPA